jgi:hypothetical protein
MEDIVLISILILLYSTIIKTRVKNKDLAFKMN